MYKANSLFGALFLCGTLFAQPSKDAYSVEPYSSAVKAEEQALTNQWVNARFGEQPAATVMPFSFKYGGVSSFELLPKWKLKKTYQKLDEHRMRHILIWTDPETRLTVKCEAVEYLDFPTVEWTLNFKNAGKRNTPILSEIHSVDMAMDAEAGNYILHHSTGDNCQADAFQPHDTKLVAGASKVIAPVGGRSTNGAMPFFNIQRENGGGCIVVIGWPGQWSANFTNDPENGMRIVGGQELTRFTLYPDEEVRTPLTVIQFYKENDYIRSQNIWRQWMLAYNTPHPNGKIVPPHFAGQGFTGTGKDVFLVNEKEQINLISRFVEEGIKPDYYWIDAGWYVMPQSIGWWEIGTWEVDKKRFPNGLRAVSDHAHAKGIKFILWFEPERVYPGTWLAENHPEWILGKNGFPVGTDGGLFNLGNPEAWNWLVNHIDAIITHEGVDLYRQDFNTDPLVHWRENDAEDRQGILEIKHVTGYLAYWDELLRRHPGMLIDACASGGRRLDIETLRRAVSLLRSDYQLNPISNQGQTYGLSLWLPIFGSGVISSELPSYYAFSPDDLKGGEPYNSRSNLTPFTDACNDMNVPANPETGEPGSADYDAIRRNYSEWKQLSPYFYGDFYPLTSYSLDKTAWIAWQFDLPKQKKGAVQVFRREGSIHDAARLKLHGLVPNVTYRVTDIDNRIDVRKSGRELMERGLIVSFDTDYGAAIVFYETETVSKL